jgi:hypothetical protein
MPARTIASDSWRLAPDFRLFRQPTELMYFGHALESKAASLPIAKIGDLCPECSEAEVVNDEGCRKCYVCGYSES